MGILVHSLLWVNAGFISSTVVPYPLAGIGAEAERLTWELQKASDPPT